MNKDYAIYDAATNMVVDVVTYLTCAIGVTDSWAKYNPGKQFAYREATKQESRDAHLIQRAVSRTIYAIP